MSGASDAAQQLEVRIQTLESELEEKATRATELAEQLETSRKERGPGRGAGGDEGRKRIG